MNVEKIRRDRRITITMTEDQDRRARAAAASRDMNLSEFGREAITQRADELGFGTQPEPTRPAAG
jgi:hypothetical protein